MERFFRHVQANGDCWEWTGARDANGYGRFTPVSRTSVITHRWLYEQMVAEIPAGLQLDHLCRNHWCVNVYDHLDPVTPLINSQRSFGHGSKTHCPLGHAYEAANTYVASGRRHCRACKTLRQPITGRHGTTTNYTYGCRCEPCREAARAYRLDYRSRRAA